MLFPQLKIEGYAPKSPPEPYYNCIAWATGDTDRYWSPIPRDRGSAGDAGPCGDYWPLGVAQENTADAWMAALAKVGFEACPSEEVEPGLEKIAIYTDGHGEPTHVARQLPNGCWTSKLGDECDLEHNTLKALEGKQYGTACHFMKRQAKR